MKMRSRNLGKYPILVTLVILTIFAGSVILGNSLEFRLEDTSIIEKAPKSPSSSQSYVVHAPIIIGNDVTFGVYNFSGVGTRNDPYLIEGYNITSPGPLSFAIDIRNTNLFFVINNCVLYSAYIGVGLNDVASGSSKIIGNKIISLTGDGGGIVLGNMQNCTISDNICTNFMQGVHLNYADGCVIRDNYFYNLQYQGINIRYSDSNIISFNRIRNAKEHGIALVGTSSSNLIHNNILDGNTWSEAYNIDGDPKGSPSSQGYDEGSHNIWYDSESQQGNTWSDYFGIGPYQIDGPSNAVDLYPSHTTGWTLFSIVISIASVAIVIVGVLLFRRFYIKKRK